MPLKNLPISDHYEYPKMIENGQIIVVNNPLMLYSPSNSNDCSLVLNSCKESSFIKKLPDLVLDAKYFQYEGNGASAQNVFDFSKKFEFESKNEVSEGLAVLEVVGHIEPDKPDLIDISKLSELGGEKSSGENCDVYELSDDDEVIFVKEYKEPEKKETEPFVEEVDSSNLDSNIRRNPVRTVRNKSRDLSKELLFEEDFAFLDTSDDEIEEKENKAIEKLPEPIKLPKEWPINVHERPEYNAATNKIESFDYTIREIQNKAATFKKPKIDSATTRKPPKKKAVVRKRRPRSVREVRKVPIEELKPLVNSATDMLKDYFVNSKKHKDMVSSKSEICSFENKLEILKNQAFLFAIVNNLDENEVVEKFKLLNIDSDIRS